jgi:hypothetical protein
MQKLLSTFALAASTAALVLAQGPPPGHGPGGPGFGPPHELMWAGPGSRTPITGAPYSAVETRQVQQTLADGNQISHQDQSKVYRDSQGRIRMEHTTPQGDTRIAIFDPVAGFEYILDPAKQTAVKRALPAPKQTSSSETTPPPPHHRFAGTTQTEDLGTETINNLAATGKRETETIPAGAIGNAQPIVVTREIWTSTVLKVPVLIKTSDARFGTTNMQLTNVVQGEPDPALFQVPSNYTVKTGGGPGMMGTHRRPN